MAALSLTAAKDLMSIKERAFNVNVKQKNTERTNDIKFNDILFIATLVFVFECCKNVKESFHALHRISFIV